MKLSLILLVFGAACLIAFKFFGSTIDAAGFVHEPFVLVISGWFLIGLGLISGIINCIYRCGARICKAAR